MQHVIRFVEDDQLPGGHDWALARTRDTYYFLVKRSQVTQAVLEEGWAAYVDMARKRDRRSA